MRSIAMLLAEHVSVDGAGRLSVSDTYNAVPASSFPAEINGIGIAIGLIFDPFDWGNVTNISVPIVDPDGNVIVSFDAAPVIFQPPHPGYPTSFFTPLSVNVVFPREGTYTFQMRVNGQLLNEVPLHIGALPN